MKQKIATGMLAAVVAALAGCNGWPDATPEGDAQHKPEKYATYTYATAEEVPMFIAEHHRYMVMPRPVNPRGSALRAVSATPATSAFALDHDAPPYGSLYVRAEDGQVRPAAVID